jgi:RNA polymerase sigma-70 factor (ECF subfamily)
VGRAVSATTTQAAYEQLRPHVFGIAYRMLGAVGEAEDVVQEAFLRLHRAERDGVDIGSPKGFLTTVTTRIAIDGLRSARARRETYVGEWLPEPIVTDPSADVAWQAELGDALSTAFLVLLEELTPAERAVFLLHDVFDHPFAEIALVVDRSEAACRQLAVRARRRIGAVPASAPADRPANAALSRRFVEACREGDEQALLELLAPDVVMVGDGGGRASALPRPLAGRPKVLAFLLALARQAAERTLELRSVELNGQPGVLALAPDGEVVGAMALVVVHDAVQGVHSVVNPDKLHHLSPARPAP